MLGLGGLVGSTVPVAFNTPFIPFKMWFLVNKQKELSGKNKGTKSNGVRDGPPGPGACRGRRVQCIPQLSFLKTRGILAIFCEAEKRCRYVPVGFLLWIFN